MAGSSLLRSLGRRMKATVAEFRSLPNAAEVRGAAAMPTAGGSAGQWTAAQLPASELLDLL